MHLVRNCHHVQCCHVGLSPQSSSFSSSKSSPSSLSWENNTDISSIIFDDVGQTLCQRAPWHQSWQMVALLPYPQSRRCHHYVFVWIHTLFVFLYFLVFHAFLVFPCTLPKVKEVSTLCICLVEYLLFFLVSYMFSCTIPTAKKSLPFCIYLGIFFFIQAGD